MPDIKPDLKDSVSGSPLEETIKLVIPSVSTIAVPVMITGVGRLVNVGNYENVSIYSALSLPMPDATIENLVELERITKEAAAIGFGIVSQETGARYELIKELQKNSKRPQ